MDALDAACTVTVVAGGRKTVDAFGRDVAAVLHRERLAQGVTLVQLAALVGVSQSQLSKQLRGERPLTLDEADRICRALGLTLADVIRDAR
ncbi:helix-turn-helix transcriptional regulator [Cryobacterium sp. BB736]|uniref:helix-turn-helix domain-containing protein n=1 Tax=Cryobacterium sp. BB736 TaxID=2746963 RepID=UPI0018773F30